MLNEIEIASKLSLIQEIEISENIVNSGRVQGINIYKDKINILLAKKKGENQSDLDKVKILSSLKIIKIFQLTL